MNTASHTSDAISMVAPGVQCIAADNVAPQAWRNGGGQTRELLAWPDARNWQLRISRADIEKSGPFSAFPGVQRWFAVLTGQGVVLHMPQPNGPEPESSPAQGDGQPATQDLRLLAGAAPLHFDGGLAPGCTLVDGATQDLNLMARGGQAHMQTVERGTAWQTTQRMCGLYTVHAGTWHCGTQSLALPAHSLLWLDTAPSEAQRFNPNPQNLGDPADPAPAGSPTAPLLAYWLAYTPETSA